MYILALLLMLLLAMNVVAAERVVAPSPRIYSYASNFGNLTESVSDENDQVDPLSTALLSTSILQKWKASLIKTDANSSFYISALLLHILYFSQEFVGPVLSTLIRIIYRLLISPLFAVAHRNLSTILPSEQLLARRQGNRQSQYNYDDDSFVARKPIAKTGKEDQKSLKGDRRDVDRLLRQGYQKHRFVSRGFLQRNDLLTYDPSNNNGDGQVPSSSEEGNISSDLLKSRKIPKL